MRLWDRGSITFVLRLWIVDLWCGFVGLCSSYAQWHHCQFGYGLWIMVVVLGFFCLGCWVTMVVRCLTIVAIRWLVMLVSWVAIWSVVLDWLCYGLPFDLWVWWLVVPWFETERGWEGESKIRSDRKKRSHRVPWVEAVGLCKLVVVGCGGGECRGVALWVCECGEWHCDRKGEREMIKKMNSF